MARKVLAIKLLTGLVLLFAATNIMAEEEKKEETLAISPNGEQLVRDNCLQCHRSDNPKYPEHNLGWILRKRYPKEGWMDNIVRMEKISIRDEYITEPWSDADKEAMAVYLTEQTRFPLSDLDRLGMLHYSVVHFPVALILIVGLYEVIGILWGWPIRRDMLHGLAWLSLISTFVAVALGLVLAWDISAMSETLNDHKIAGMCTLAFVAAAILLREVAASTGKGAPKWGYRLLLLLSIAAVGATGHLGGELVHGEYIPFLVAG